MTKKLASLVTILGIVLLAVGIFLWQTGLNNQELTTVEQRYSPPPEHHRVGQQQEVAGLVLLAIGAVTAVGGGLVLIKK